MRRLASLLIALAVAFALAGPSATAAPSLGSQARGFQVEAMQLLTRYEQQLAPRLPGSDQRQLTLTIRQAGTSLAALTKATRALEAAGPKRKAVRKAQALRAFEDAKRAEESALEQVQPLALRHLGLGEMLRARSDLERMQARFAYLGEAIRAA